jgi:hypothetical protein
MVFAERVVETKIDGIVVTCVDKLFAYKELVRKLPSGFCIVAEESSRVENPSAV